MPAATVTRIAELLATQRPSTILYALGATQHSYGVQQIRSYAILQLLLGNMGMPGGGVGANRGESNVQGATDMGLAWNYLPGLPGHAVDGRARPSTPTARATAARWRPS